MRGTRTYMLHGMRAHSVLCSNVRVRIFLRIFPCPSQSRGDLAQALESIFEFHQTMQLGRCVSERLREGTSVSAVKTQ